jgi:hypothetical protein
MYECVAPIYPKPWPPLRFPEMLLRDALRQVEIRLLRAERITRLSPRLDKRLGSRGRFERQPHVKLRAIGACAGTDFSVMPFNDDSVGDDESKSRA